MSPSIANQFPGLASEFTGLRRTRETKVLDEEKETKTKRRRGWMGRPLTLADDRVASLNLSCCLSFHPFGVFFLPCFFLSDVAVARVEMASSIYEAKARKG